VRGNHDAASQITKHLRLPENVHELSVHAPQSLAFERLGVVVHGQGFPSRAVTDDLAARYPSATPGALNIGLLHTSVDGREGHEPYAPCRLPTLLDKGYDYWALGHVHRREVLARDPWVVFPGNLQGRQAREAGEKGASVVTAEGGRIVSVEHRALDVFRWCTAEVDARGARSGHDVVDLVRDALEHAVTDADGRALAVRIVIAGTTDAHTALVSDAERWTSEIRATANDVGQQQVWVEKVLLATQSTINLAALRARDDAIGQLARSLEAIATDPEGSGDLLRELVDLRQKLPLEAREGDRGIRLDANQIREIVRDVEEMLLPRLLAKELEP
jgi:exonuclease SbcD